MMTEPPDTQLEEMRALGQEGLKKKQERELMWSIVFVSAIVGLVLYGVSWVFGW
jgi:hypothetical protein